MRTEENFLKFLEHTSETTRLLPKIELDISDKVLKFMEVCVKILQYEQGTNL